MAVFFKRIYISANEILGRREYMFSVATCATPPRPLLGKQRPRTSISHFPANSNIANSSRDIIHLQEFKSKKFKCVCTTRADEIYQHKDDEEFFRHLNGRYNYHTGWKSLPFDKAYTALGWPRLPSASNRKAAVFSYHFNRTFSDSLQEVNGFLRHECQTYAP